MCCDITLLFSALSLTVSSGEALIAFMPEFTDGLSTGAIVEVSACFDVLIGWVRGGMKISTGKVALSGSSSKIFGPQPIVNLIPG